MSNAQNEANAGNGVQVAKALLGGIYGAYSAWTAGLEGSRNLGSLNSAFSSSSLVKTETMMEKDYEVVSGVEVYLYTRPIEGQLVSAKHQQHWSLVFLFPDTQRWITHEASQDEDGVLIAYCSNERPKEEQGGEVRLLGKCTISPQKLLKMAKSNSCNNKTYNMFFQNCQEWVKELAQRIGGAIWAVLKDEETLFEKDPLTGLIGGIAQLSSGALFTSSQASGHSQAKPPASKRNYYFDHDDDDY